MKLWQLENDVEGGEGEVEVGESSAEDEGGEEGGGSEEDVDREPDASDGDDDDKDGGEEEDEEAEIFGYEKIEKSELDQLARSGGEMRNRLVVGTKIQPLALIA